MKVINLILASGKGSRLKLSTEDKPKQFLCLYNCRTMLENTMYRYLPLVDDTYTVTLRKYEKYVKGRFPKVVYEPVRNESAYSVLRALMDIEEQEGDCIIIQTPSDHALHANESFYQAMKSGVAWARYGAIAAIGVKPTRPESDYGYMKSNEPIEKRFVEKPDEEEAKQYIEEGYIWNTAIYVYRLSDMIREFRKYEKSMFVEWYQGKPKQFEKVIIQKTSRLKIIEGVFDWDDLGTHERVMNWLGGEINGRKKEQINT